MTTERIVRVATGVFVVGCLALFWCGMAGAGEGPLKVQVLTDASFHPRIAKGVVLVDFWASWCGPCRLQGPIVEEVADQLQGKAGVAKVNVDDSPRVAEEYNIEGIPALVVFKEGKPVRRFVGVTDASALVAAVKEALAAP